MMRTLSLFTCLVVTLCLLPMARADSIDQSLTTFNGLTELDYTINEGAVAVAQTFTAGITGDLTRIEIAVYSQPIHGGLDEISPFAVNVEILGVSNGLPTSN